MHSVRRTGSVWMLPGHSGRPVDLDRVRSDFARISGFPMQDIRACFSFAITTAALARAKPDDSGCRLHPELPVGEDVLGLRPVLERVQEELLAAWRGRNLKYRDGKSKTPSGVWQGSNVVGKRYRHAYPFKLGKQFLGLR